MSMRRWQQWLWAALLLARFTESYYFIGSSNKRRSSFVGGHGTKAGRRRLYSTVNLPTEAIDTRPHIQRATRPRTARRSNHAFRYLFRHDDHRHNQTTIVHLTSLEFLVQYGGYTYEQVYQMNKTFPPLLELDIRRHLWPKLRFLEETIRIGKNQTTLIPAQYFGARLERTIAPRHAFLVYNNLPHGRQLLQQTEDGKIPWHDFLVSCRRTKQFCTLCNSWRQLDQPKVSAQQIEAFDTLFQRGLMAAARDELCQRNNTWPLDHINITSGEIISLLIQHGANPVERDTRGVTLLHWAAGSGNLGAVQELLPHFQDGIFTEAERDGATPFHWAVAGAKAREFGCGGHPEVCRYFLEQLDREGKRRLVNKVTKDGNSVLMWAAWSGTLEVVKLLIRNRAVPTICNRNGCTVSHWAASGGNLQMCHYLAQTVGVDFIEPNFGGNTPLTHAVAFGRADVVEWLLNDIYVESDDCAAAELAKDFVGWTDGDRNRKEVLYLFQDWFGRDDDNVVDDEKNDDDDDGDDELDY